MSFGGGWSGGQTIVLGYSTYGPVHWAMHQVYDWCGWWRGGNLPDSFFPTYMSQLSRIKLTYMFGSQNPQQIHQPNWIGDYNAARTAATNPANHPYQTLYYVLQIYSSVPEGGQGWLGHGTWAVPPAPPMPPGLPVSPPPVPAAMAWWPSGWLDLGAQQGWQRLDNYIWKRTAVGSSTDFPQIGIVPKTDPKTGLQILTPQPVYFVEFAVFGGLDIGTNGTVTNPCNWTSSDQLPIPYLLDTSVGDYNMNGVGNGGSFPIPQQAGAFNPFYFLGVARRSAQSQFWQQRFPAANPSGNMVAVAQAKIFNNSSWDLWTQDCGAGLVPVSNWENWTAEMTADAAQAASTNGVVQPSDVTDVATYLNRIDPKLVSGFMTH